MNSYVYVQGSIFILAYLLLYSHFFVVERLKIGEC